METDVQSKILTVFKGFKAWAFKTIASSRGGTPDVIACMPVTRDEMISLFNERDTVGLFVAIEVKDSNKPAKGRKLQEVQMRRIREVGGITLVANDPQQVKALLYEIKNGQGKNK